MNDAEQNTGLPQEPPRAVVGSAAEIGASPPRTAEATAPMALESLAPLYDEEQHGTYLRHLETVLKDPRNRNIALSGRYGTGKSSVLDKFGEKHGTSTLRLAVSTLAPDAAGVSLTNRIQKEVLKQLVYSARARTLRHSRFSRRGPLSWWRAVVESALMVAVFGALLALFGYLPAPSALGSTNSVGARAAVWVLTAILFIVVIATLRMITHNRFVVSDVSAAGATLRLTEPTQTYFDEYLDEIVYFFDQEPKDIVVFEDLDRYDDPQIFQALRELNTLLNNTPKRLERIMKHNEPLRFIYAMRDSLFERIGEDTAKEGDDAARAETVRANRTKFFDVVIPVVPFISHRTAREHLHQLLHEARIAGIARPLIELVAKHATDMRLLINMRNEYLVFAERLLQSDKVAPELSPSHLFALVAYKQFHLEDFDNISRRASDLDRLYDYQRDLVATSVAVREKAKRDLLAGISRPLAIGPVAKRLGLQLITFATVLRDQSNGRKHWQLSFHVDSKQYEPDAVTTAEFWETVVAAGAITLQAAGQPLGTLSADDLKTLFPELEGSWVAKNAEAVDEELQQLDRDIEALRGAGFEELADAPNYRLAVPAREADAGTEDLTFGQLVDRTLKSDMARDLVRQGYIDRNYSLYAAQFYGDFTGVDVATFIVQTVQTNTMDINYQFTSPGAFANLLAEADEDFMRTISAYNLQMVDHLLVNDPEKADEVLQHLTSDFGSESEQFLAAFFTSNGHRTQLASRLSDQPWPRVFTYLVSSEGVPADVRSALVDSALVAAHPDGAYELGPHIGDYLVAHYQEMPAFTEPHTRSEFETVVTMLRRAEVLVPNLDRVHEALRALLIENSLYELTAANLRTALDTTGDVSLDRVRDSDIVYQYCLSKLDTYLAAVDADDDTDYAVLTPQTLVDALEADVSDDKILDRLAATASPASTLLLVTDAPKSTWPVLAAAHLFRASLANVEAYRVEVGSIDANLGELLVSAGVFFTDDADTPAAGAGENDAQAPDSAAVAVAVLNARQSIPSPEDRVQLVRSLELDAPLPAAKITPEGAVFALLLKHELIPDDPTTFAHLRTSGWSALGPAIAASTNIPTFVTPDLVEGMVAEVLATPATREVIGTRVLSSLGEFLPTDDLEALTAAADYAIHTSTALSVDQVRRVARVCGDAQLTVGLLQIAAAPADDIVMVLSELGGNYGYLTTWERDEFEVPQDDAHEVVFKVLSDAGRCQFRKKRMQPFLIVQKA